MKKRIVPKTDPRTFWNAEYKTHEHFALSYTVSEELEHFARYLERNHAGVPRGLHVLDVGCGNGRNIAWLARTYGATGTGFDFADSAIEEAQVKAQGLPLIFRTQDIHSPFPEHNATYDIVIDFMVSHVLTGQERTAYLQEVHRVLKPGGWFVVKTLLRDDDAHAERMLAETHEKGEGVYVHPRTGGAEYAGTEKALVSEYGAHFLIEKKQKSHAHRVHGKPNKRRFIVFYLVKDKFSA
jgi:cyclopropane fatty-acyl-phospholipid synthase-like methyltransferase